MFELLELGRLELSLPAATLMFPVFVDSLKCDVALKSRAMFDITH